MKKLYLWAFHHPVLFFLASSGIYVGLVTYWAIVGQWPWPLILVVDGILLLLMGLTVKGVPSTLNNIAVKALETECDADGLQEMSALLLTKKLGAQQHLVITLNRATALREHGELSKHLEILQSIHIDKVPCLPVYRLIYYHNLALAYWDVGQLEMAELCRQKVGELYTDLKNPKQREAFATQKITLDVTSLYHAGDCESACRLLQTAPAPKTRRGQVELAATWARLLTARGMRTEAAVHWQYVIANGNTLYCVQEARRALSEDTL